MILALTVLTTQLFAQTETVAVLPLSWAGVDSESASAVTEYVQSAIASSGTYKVTERREIQKVLREQSFQMAGVTDPQNAARAGQLLSVNKVVMGSITKLGEQYTLVLKIVDVSTGSVLKTVKKPGRIQIEDIDNSLVVPGVNELLAGQARSGYTLVVKKCTNLAKMHLFSDLYSVEVYVSNEMLGQTKSVKGTYSPEFNDRFDIPTYSGEVIRLVVIDNGMTGRIIVGIATITSPQSGPYQLYLEKGGKRYRQGQIDVAFEK
jgi:hypothetical protein